MIPPLFIAPNRMNFSPISKNDTCVNPAHLMVKFVIYGNFKKNNTTNIIGYCVSYTHVKNAAGVAAQNIAIDILSRKADIFFTRARSTSSPIPAFSKPPAPSSLLPGAGGSLSPQN